MNRPESTPVFPFSADPPTLGHRDLVARAVALFGSCAVVLARHAGKTPLFSPEARRRLAQATFAGIPSVTVDLCEGLLADWCYRRGHRYLIRGLRGGHDLEAELALAAGHARQVPGLETLYLPATGAMAHVSSSMARAIAAEQGDLRGYVALPVKQALEEALHGQYRLCVTGPISCGKSTLVEKLLSVLRRQKILAEEIDMDQITQLVYQGPDEGVSHAFAENLTRLLGPGVLGANGFAQKSKVRQLVLADATGAARAHLADAIRQPLEILLRGRLMGRRGILFMAAAVAAEGDWLWHTNNHVLLVKADAEVQLARLMARDGIDREEASRRIAFSGTAESKAHSVGALQKRDQWGSLLECDTTKPLSPEGVEALAEKITSLFPGARPS